jgi:hypothetical protein
MTKEELVKFLKENLSVDMSLYIDHCYSANRLQVRVTVNIGEEEICETKDYVDFPNADCCS